MAHKLLCWLFGMHCLHTTPLHHGSYTDYQEVQAFINHAVELGIAPAEQMQHWFEQARYKPAVIQAIHTPAEHLQWQQYRPIFLTNARIQQGVVFWQQHHSELARAEQQYQVPASIIVAILGVETRYGTQMGHYRVLDSLTTLAFDEPERAHFFREELLAYFQLCQQQHVDPTTPVGSYAGAMGYPQFMPSSWLKEAVDFNQDGHIDLINQPADAIGSIAHYLHDAGWHRGPVAELAQIAGDRYDVHLNTLLHSTASLNEWATWGITPGNNVSREPATMANVIRLQGEHGAEYWLAYDNFFVITRYNHSPLYAMAVWQLGNAIADELAKTAPLGP